MTDRKNFKSANYNIKRQTMWKLAREVENDPTLAAGDDRERSMKMMEKIPDIKLAAEFSKTLWRLSALREKDQTVGLNPTDVVGAMPTSVFYRPTVSKTPWSTK